MSCASIRPDKPNRRRSAQEQRRIGPPLFSTFRAGGNSGSRVGGDRERGRDDGKRRDWVRVFDHNLSMDDVFLIGEV
jgi:hypothetical protein